MPVGVAGCSGDVDRAGIWSCGLGSQFDIYLERTRAWGPSQLCRPPWSGNRGSRHQSRWSEGGLLGLVSPLLQGHTLSLAISVAKVWSEVVPQPFLYTAKRMRG